MDKFIIRTEDFVGIESLRRILLLLLPPAAAAPVEPARTFPSTCIRAVQKIAVVARDCKIIWAEILVHQLYEVCSLIRWISSDRATSFLMSRGVAP